MDDKTKDLLSEIEEANQCSGVCRNPGYFIFSNVNNGLPKQTCKEAIANEFQKSVTTVVATNVTTTVVTAVLLGFVVLLFIKRIYDRCFSKVCEKACRRVCRKRRKSFKNPPEVELETELPSAREEQRDQYGKVGARDSRVTSNNGGSNGQKENKQTPRKIDMSATFDDEDLNDRAEGEII